MKFDKLVNRLITEIKGSIAGYVHKGADHINTQTIFSDFETTLNPEPLLDAVAFAQANVNVPIKVGKKALAGSAFIEFLKTNVFEIFDVKTKPPKTNKILVPVENYEDRSMGETKIGLAGRDAPNFSKKFIPANMSKGLDPVERDIWFKVINRIFTEFQRPDTIRQEGEVKKVFFKYKTDKNQTVESWVTVRKNDNTITGTPFSSNIRYENPVHHPKNGPEKFSELIAELDAEGGTFDALMQIIQGSKTREKLD